MAGVLLVAEYGMYPISIITLSIIWYTGLSIGGAIIGGVLAWNYLPRKQHRLQQEEEKPSLEWKMELYSSWNDTIEFYKCVFFFLSGGNYGDCRFFSKVETGRNIRARIFGMCLVFRLWSSKHYRHGSFQDDMRKNLRNVAIPGTGLPLSVFALFKPLALFFILVLYPITALVSGIHLGRPDIAAVSRAYRKQLLEPTDWFGFWRLNCALASYHAGVTNDSAYELEDKLKFLQVAEEKGVAVSPYLKIPQIVCKHRNEEGGMGIVFFTNADSGGDWIIQEVLQNNEKISAMLPENSPLSTFRVITISSFDEQDTVALSCVWRAGRKYAKTDHSAVLYDVHPSGEFMQGVSNEHWYQLGVDKAFTTPWTMTRNITHHPDSGTLISGQRVDATSIMEFARSAHRKMMPSIPIVGWDVALSNKGMLMLECNLSCNFFCGSFDQTAYFTFVDKCFNNLEKRI